MKDYGIYLAGVEKQKMKIKEWWENILFEIRFYLKKRKLKKLDPFVYKISDEN